MTLKYEQEFVLVTYRIYGFKIIFKSGMADGSDIKVWTRICLGDVPFMPVP